MMIFNEKLFEHIDEKELWIGEILLYLIYRNYDPIEILSNFESDDLLVSANNCLTVFTNYRIIESKSEGGFLLKRPLFVSEAVSQKYNTKDIRKFFYKSFCQEDNRNTADYIVQLLIVKFLEKHPYKWEDIVKVTERFMTDMMSKNKSDRYIPKMETFIVDPKYLLTLLEELEVQEDIEKLNSQKTKDFDFDNDEFHL